MEPRSVDIMAYTNETVKLFWTANGPWKQSKQPMERRIVVVAGSVGGRWMRLFAAVTDFVLLEGV